MTEYAPEFRFRKTCDCKAVSFCTYSLALMHQTEKDAVTTLSVDDPPACSKCHTEWVLEERYRD